jgi:WD40 repeat protein
LLVSGGDDQTVRLWNVETGEIITTLQGHTDRVWSVAFSCDNETLASGSNDGTIRLWQKASKTATKILRSERPYEHMDITGVTGLTAAQKAALKALGAIENKQ